MLAEDQTPRWPAGELCSGERRPGEWGPGATGSGEGRGGLCPAAASSRGGGGTRLDLRRGSHSRPGFPRIFAFNKKRDSGGTRRLAARVPKKSRVRSRGFGVPSAAPPHRCPIPPLRRPVHTAAQTLSVALDTPGRPFPGHAHSGTRPPLPQPGQLPWGSGLGELVPSISRLVQA